MPYYSKTALENSVTVTKIKVTANENIAGTYDFSDSGLASTPSANGSKSIELSLTGTFYIPTAADYQKNAAIMVIAPGTYTNVVIEYTLRDSRTNVTGTVSKTYPSVTFTAGKNKPVRYDLAMETYNDNKYYLWDAQTEFWEGFTGNRPLVNGEQAYYTFPVSSEANLNATQHNAQNALSTCPNANAMTWYVFNGSPHWDSNTLWVMMGHLYKGGMWFKKSTEIPGFSSSIYNHGGGKDYSGTYWSDWKENTRPEWKTTPTQSKPTDTTPYFFLPAKGYAGRDGKFYMGDTNYVGVYWSSIATTLTNGGTQAVALYFSSSVVGLDVDDRNAWAYPIFSIQ